jgi:hypothetical protein
MILEFDQVKRDKTLLERGLDFQVQLRSLMASTSLVRTREWNMRRTDLSLWVG